MMTADHPPGIQAVTADFPTGIQKAIGNYPTGIQTVTADYPTGRQTVTTDWPLVVNLHTWHAACWLSKCPRTFTPGYLACISPNEHALRADLRMAYTGLNHHRTGLDSLHLTKPSFQHSSLKYCIRSIKTKIWRILQEIKLQIFCVLKRHKIGLYFLKYKYKSKSNLN